MRLSVLDLAPVRTDQTTSDAVRASLDLARVADEVGAARYWVAEHHNMPAVAATNPPVLIGLLAGISLLTTIGAILLVVGLVLNLVPIGGTRRRVF